MIRKFNKNQTTTITTPKNGNKKIKSKLFTKEQLEEKMKITKEIIENKVEKKKVKKLNSVESTISKKNQLKKNKVLITLELVQEKNKLEKLSKIVKQEPEIKSTKIPEIIGEKKLKTVTVAINTISKKNVTTKIPVKNRTISKQQLPK